MKITLNAEREKAVDWLCKSLQCSESELVNVLIMQRWDELATAGPGLMRDFIETDKVLQRREEKGLVKFFDLPDGRGFFDETTQINYKTRTIVIPQAPKIVKGHYENVFVSDE